MFTLLGVLTMLALTMLQARLMDHRPASDNVASGHFAPRTAARTEAARRDRDLERNADLIVPVYGVGVSQLADTWGAARAAGRVHQGVDIMAPAGTIVRAVAPGKVAKLFFSERGGITVYEVSADGRYIFYYAHLQRYAPGLKEGDTLAQGQAIAYVGMTGNAPVPHLHFEIQRAPDDGKWWRGEAFNPYPSLLAGRILSN